MFVNHWSTKLTSWSGVCYTLIEKKVMEIKEDIKIREILEKEESLRKKKRTSIWSRQVPTYGKSRSGRVWWIYKRICT